MPHKLKKQYRLYGYDYAQNGSYFTTIVTRDRESFFGTIQNAEMQYTPIGQYCVHNIRQVQQQKSDISIDSWVVMPNHIHLLLTIDACEKETPPPLGLQPLVKGSVSLFVNHFKGTISKWCKQNGHAAFAWQARFHDRVVRDAAEYFAIRNYIGNNIQNWEKDRENK